MSTQPSDRMQKLQSLLERDPNDTFLLYAIALEHKKANDFVAALQWFDRVVEKDPGYSVAYHQAGLTHEAAGDIAAAKATYRRGIAAATKKGDHHAAEEMQAALSMIE
jgi:tetratricopeptide (TPR) repeat protein